MKERPILFSAPMVRAILAGIKNQTRRVVKPHPPVGFNLLTYRTESGFVYAADYDKLVWDKPQRVRWESPYGQPGDRLWVREAFSGPWCMEVQDGMAAVPPSKWGESSRIWYWADGEPTYGDWTKPRPSIHMPRWASRITLEITEVRVERLQDISDEDSLAEGIYPTSTGLYPGSPRAAYQKLWEQINGPGSWEANPWVWCVSFKRLEAA